MLQKIHFRFHDIASVKIHSDSEFVNSFYKSEYGYHLVDEITSDLPTVRLDFELGRTNSRDFFFHTHKLLAKWAYQISLDRTGINHKVIGNQISVPLVHHMEIHPSLRYVASQEGTLLLHAGAVARDGKSLIFTGQGGSGKTTTTSLLLDSSPDWHFHADDYVFIKPAGVSLAYVTRSHLYQSILNWLPDISSRLTTRERIELSFFGFLRSKSGENIKWPVRISQNRLWPNNAIENQANIAAIIILQQNGLEPSKLVELDDKQSVADELFEMNFGEARHFIRLLRRGGSAYEPMLEQWKENERNLLRTIVDQIPIFKLNVPRSTNPEVIRDSMRSLVEGLLY